MQKCTLQTYLKMKSANTFPLKNRHLSFKISILKNKQHFFLQKIRLSDTRNLQYQSDVKIIQS